MWEDLRSEWRNDDGDAHKEPVDDQGRHHADGIAKHISPHLLGVGVDVEHTVMTSYFVS